MRDKITALLYRYVLYDEQCGFRLWFMMKIMKMILEVLELIFFNYLKSMNIRINHRLHSKNMQDNT